MTAPAPSPASPSGLPQRLRALLTVGVERRGFLCAVKPWHVLLGGYALFAVVCVLNAQNPWAFTAVRAAAVAYAAVAAALFVFPVGQAVLLKHREEDATASDQRMLDLTVAWAIVALAMLPLMAIISGSDALRPLLGETTRSSLFSSFSLRSRVQMGGFLAIPRQETASLVFGLPHIEAIALRALNDLSILLFVVAVGYWAARRCKTKSLAMLWGYSLSALALLTVLSQDVVGVLTIEAAYRLLPAPDPDPTRVFEMIDSGMEQRTNAVRMITNSVMCGVLLVRFGLAYFVAGRHLCARPTTGPIPRELRPDKEQGS